MTAKQISMRNSVLDKAFKVREELEKMRKRYCKNTPWIKYEENETYDESANAILCALASIEEFIERNNYE